MSKISLYYFEFKGRAEAIRLAFKIGKIQFTDIRFSLEEFAKKKEAGKFKFGQLPVLEIDGEQYAQTQAILKYTGRLAGLYPQTYLDQMIVDEGSQLADEIFVQLSYAVFMVQGEQAKQEALEKLQKEHLPRLLGYYNKKVSESHSGFYGKSLSVADLMAYVAIDWVTNGPMEGVKYDMNQHKGLIQLVKQIEKIPEVAEWNLKNQK